MKDFHLPLPEQTYAELRAEAERVRRPATMIAREAIAVWLRVRKKALRHNAIAEFASEAAGTEFDLDASLESAAIEQLMKLVRWTPCGEAKYIGRSRRVQSQLDCRAKLSKRIGMLTPDLARNLEAGLKAALDLD